MAQAEKKRFFIQTFGCQMNVSDGERMQALMAESGFDQTEKANEADVILINGCSVREKAVHKAVSLLGTFREFKDGGSPIIGVTGCVGQLEKESLFRRAPFLDFVMGPDAIDELPEILHRVQAGERRQVYAKFDRHEKYSTETKVLGTRAQAYVNIMKGCDKYCSYCIVPFTRGPEKSRTIDEVVDDVAKLVSRGVKEVTLLGQNVNSFGKNNPNSKNREPQELHNPIGKVGPRKGEENFPQLLRVLDTDPRLADLKRIRFTSSHPLDFSDELIDCYAPPEKGGVARLARQLHLPVQTGSNSVLQRMSRHHQIENYIAQMERLRALDPSVGLSTDLIVGFPGETEEEFEATLKLLDRLQFDAVYAFAYSPRPGTKAARLKDDVPAKVKSERLNRLLDHQLEITKRTYQRYIGNTYEVLVEDLAKSQTMDESLMGGLTSKADHGVWMGRTSCNRVVHFKAPLHRKLKGKLLDVRILSATALALYGELGGVETQALEQGSAS